MFRHQPCVHAVD